MTYVTSRSSVPPGPGGAAEGRHARLSAGTGSARWVRGRKPERARGGVGEGWPPSSTFATRLWAKRCQIRELLAGSDRKFVGDHSGWNPRDLRPAQIEGAIGVAVSGTRVSGCSPRKPTRWSPCSRTRDCPNLRRPPQGPGCRRSASSRSAGIRYEREAGPPRANEQFRWFGGGGR